MERIDQTERMMTERLDRQDRRLRAMEDHFHIHRSPTPTPHQEEGPSGTSQGAEEAVDPRSAICMKTFRRFHLLLLYFSFIVFGSTFVVFLLEFLVLPIR